MQTPCTAISQRHSIGGRLFNKDTCRDDHFLELKDHLSICTRQNFELKKRLTVEKALAHPDLEAYVRTYTLAGVLVLRVLQHDPEDEPIAPPLDAEFFEFDSMWSAIRLAKKTRMIPSFRQMKARKSGMRHNLVLDRS